MFCRITITTSWAWRQSIRAARLWSLERAASCGTNCLEMLADSGTQIVLTLFEELSNTGPGWCLLLESPGRTTFSPLNRMVRCVLLWAKEATPSSGEPHGRGLAEQKLIVCFKHDYAFPTLEVRHLLWLSGSFCLLVQALDPLDPVIAL